MSNVCKYRILPEHRLVISSYNGSISEKEIILTKEGVLRDKAFKMEYNILDDFSGVEFEITKESFTRILLWLKENFSWNRKSAVIAQTPAQVASIIRFDALNRESLPMEIKIFNTPQAALLWMGIDRKDVPAIEAALKALHQGS